MINLRLNNDELQALLKLMDGGVRHFGIDSAINAAALVQKINAAVSKANTPKAQEDTDNG
jgi:hypothetical protein